MRIPRPLASRPKACNRRTTVLQRRYVSYLRVSTDRQGRSGLGIEAQRRAVTDYLARFGEAAVLLREYVEIESGKRNDRPQLKAALDYANLTGATLIIAKLDRLSRNAHFLSGLQEAGIRFIACDFPDASELTIGIMAQVAQHERKMISERTRAALAAARARGRRRDGSRLRIGNPQGVMPASRKDRLRGSAAGVKAIKARADAYADRMRPVLAALRAEGFESAAAIARELNARYIETPRGAAWDAKAVIRLDARLQASG